MPLTTTELVGIIAAEIEDIRFGEIPAADIAPDTLLWSVSEEALSLGLESVELFELVYRVEARSGLRFPEDFELVSITSVGDLAERLTAG
ncbi:MULTISPECIES: hypothetical protein [unclassified Streptomyces]|uniref:hypothetical protein n=1 Tax=Streptomycetaceae TaxID=2062 RepID=UPI0005F94E3C|nr:MULTISPECIES: hypothetical protein [unclassified Streptomyces]KJY30423.1 hypothetical protein VR45_27650 [Streptomyces sp. NRRL S-495]KOV35574.1 hypothetical protein ADK60_08900 [Streptomyces sp. XY431]